MAQITKISSKPLQPKAKLSYICITRLELFLVQGSFILFIAGRAVLEEIFFGAALILNTLAKAASNQSGGNLT